MITYFISVQVRNADFRREAYALSLCSEYFRDSSGWFKQRKKLIFVEGESVDMKFLFSLTLNSPRYKVLEKVRLKAGATEDSGLQNLQISLEGIFGKGAHHRGLSSGSNIFSFIIHLIRQIKNGQKKLAGGAYSLPTGSSGSQFRGKIPEKCGRKIQKNTLQLPSRELIVESSIM